MPLIDLEKAVKALKRCQCYPDDIMWRTEDPPQEEKHYLITDNGGGLDICLWTNKLFGKEVEYWYWNTGTYQKVVAWLPLPVPYKGVKENEK